MTDDNIPRVTTPEAQSFGRAFDSPHASGDSDVGLREMVAAVRRGRKTLLAAIVLGVGVAFAVLTYITPKFQAEALILIEPQEPRSVIVEAAVAGLMRDAEAVRSETYVLASSAMADRIIGRLNLIDDPEFNPDPKPQSSFLRALCGGVESLIGMQPGVCQDDGQGSAADPQMDNMRYSQLVDRFNKSLQVVALEKSRVIAVRFLSTNARKAQEIANTVAQQYLALREEAKFESTSRVTTWLGDQIAELRAAVAAGEEQIESLRQLHGLVDGDRGDLSSQEVGQVSTQLVMARAARAEAEARLGQVEVLLTSQSGVKTASEVLDSPLIQRLRAQETTLRGEVAELSAELGDRHPRMLQLQAEVRGIRTEIDAEIAKIIAGLQNQVAVAKARERSFERALAGIKARVATANQNEIEVRALEREVDANRTLLTNLLNRQKQTAPQGSPGFLQADARIISLAGLPAKATYPNKPFVLAFAFLASIMLGGLIILLRELFEGGFRSIEQLEAQTGIAALGFLPEADLGRKSGTEGTYIIDKPASAFANAVRTLNWSVKLVFPESSPTTLLITSAIPNEGKSTIAVNLCMSLSQTGKRTLVIDADIRKPIIHERLDSDQVPGLAEYLAGDVDIEQVIRRDCVQQGLDLIPAGNPPADVPSILGSGRMRLLLESLKPKYDLIVIDSSPIMVGADAPLLCRLADATIVVVRWGTTPRQTVKLALRNIQSVGAVLAGTVLSMVNVKKYAGYSYGDSGAYVGELAKYYSAS